MRSIFVLRIHLRQLILYLPLRLIHRKGRVLTGFVRHCFILRYWAELCRRAVRSSFAHQSVHEILLFSVSRRIVFHVSEIEPASRRKFAALGVRRSSCERCSLGSGAAVWHFGAVHCDKPLEFIGCGRSMMPLAGVTRAETRRVADIARDQWGYLMTMKCSEDSRFLIRSRRVRCKVDTGRRSKVCGSAVPTGLHRGNGACPVDGGIGHDRSGPPWVYCAPGFSVTRSGKI